MGIAFFSSTPPHGEVMATEHKIANDIVIEETRRAGVYRRRRLDLAERWARDGTISEEMYLAAVKFGHIFEAAHLRERYAISTASLDRVDGSRGDNDGESARTSDARHSIIQAMALLGSSMGPVMWDVLGSGLSLREFVARQTNVSRVTVQEARGRLISGLDLLARSWA